MYHFYKSHLLGVLFLFCAFTGFAQLPFGAPASNWTLTDLDGNSHTLFEDYLDQGKTVIIDFSATWCGPCWNYHQTHRLNDLYEAYGPDGTDEIMVFYLESDLGTNINCLYGSSGCNGGTQGDWVTGTPYPIVDLTSATNYVKSDYQVSYYPTLYAVCPDRKVFEVGQASLSVWEDWLLESCPLDFSAVISDLECYSDMDGGIDVTTVAGHGNLFYDWSNGDETEDLIDAVPGTYTITITDSNFRSIESGDMLVDGPLTALEIDILQQENISCNGQDDGMGEVIGSGGTPGYTYDWGNGLTGPIQFGLNPGTYVVSVLDGNDCIEEVNVDIIEPDELTATSVAYDENCGSIDGIAEYLGAGGTGAIHYDIGGDNNFTGIFVGLSAGTYSATITDMNGCTTIKTETIENIPPPIAEAGPTVNVDCTNITIDLDGTGSETGGNILYNWTTTDGNIVDGTTTLTPTVDEPGTYTIEVFNNSNGCVSLDQVIVGSLVDLPDADAGEADDINCNMNNITLDGSDSESGANITYEWQTNDGNIVDGGNTTAPIVDAAGTYTIIVTNETNGCNSEASVEVAVNTAVPTADAGPQGMLDCTTPLGILDGSGSESGDNINYTWTTTDGNIVDGEDGLNPIVDAPGTYTILVTNEDNGCTSEASVTVGQDISTPIAEVNDVQLTCDTPNATICADSEQDLAFLWSDGSTDQCITVNGPGAYTVELTGLNGCNTTLTAEALASTDLPVIDAGDDVEVDCNFTNISLNAEGDSGDQFDYSWTTDDGVIDNGDDTANPVISSTGTYTITIINTENGCQNIDQVTITQLINNPVSLFVEDINDSEVNFTDNSEGTPTGWSWDFGDSNMSSEQNPSHTYTVSGTYTVCLTIVNECGEDTTCEDITVEVSEILNYSFQFSDASCHGFNDGEIIIDPIGGAPDYAITWTGPNGFTSNLFHLTDLVAGEYSMELTDALDNVITETFVISEPNEITYEGEVSHVDCADSATGFISGEGSGGIEPLNYSWSNSATTASISDLEAGTYTCSISDANNCIEEFSFEVLGADPVKLETSQITDASSGNSDGAVDSTVEGGTEPYEFNWDNGAETEDLTGVPAGEYVCLVTDANGCITTFGPFVVKSFSSVENLDGLVGFDVYPNPAEAFINVDLEFESALEFNVTIYNKLGESLHAFRNNARSYSDRLEVSDYVAGIYLLVITTDKGSITKKIMIQ